jgi:phosphatidylglycerol:prolipoprotein diacylglycerol transferase
MLPLPPDPVLFSVGPLNVGWYGLLYAVGLFAVYQFMMREAKRRKLDAELIANGLIIISIAALVGGRLYHVIDAWDRYSLNPIGALIPPYAGLGAPGGIVTVGLGGRCRTCHLGDAGDCPVGELVQPGALRTANRSPVGARH